MANDAERIFHRRIILAQVDAGEGLQGLTTFEDCGVLWNLPDHRPRCRLYAVNLRDPIWNFALEWSLFGVDASLGAETRRAGLIYSPVGYPSRNRPVMTTGFSLETYARPNRNPAALMRPREVLSATVIRERMRTTVSDMLARLKGETAERLGQTPGVLECAGLALTKMLGDAQMTMDARNMRDPRGRLELLEDDDEYPGANPVDDPLKGGGQDGDD